MLNSLFLINVCFDYTYCIHGLINFKSLFAYCKHRKYIGVRQWENIKLVIN